MSSRAAASRKRLNTGQEKRPSSSKGFFSRSKSATVVATQIDNNSSLPPISTVPRTTNHDSSQTTPYQSQDNLAERLYTRPSSFSAQPSRNSPFPQSSSPSLRKMQTSEPLIGSGLRSAYPSPPQEYQPIRLTPNSSRGISPPGSYQEAMSYIEASYQPPPPIQASYQPAPPPQSTRSTGQRSLPSLPGKNAESSSAFGSLSTFPSPPSYPPPVSSTASFSPSPRQDSLRLRSSSSPSSSRAHSPVPTLPTYSSSELPYISAQVARPPLQVLTHNTPQTHPEYNQYNERLLYPSPPSPNPIRIATTLHVQEIPADAFLSSNEPDRRRAWYGQGGNQLSAPSSPSRVTFQTPPSPSTSPQFRPPESISDSSDSSGRLSDASPAPPTKFVYPGSRSIARPKVPKKMNSPVKIGGRNESRRGQESDGHLSSPTSDTPNLPQLPLPLPERRDTPVVHLNRNAYSPNYARSQEAFSDTSSAFSDNSDIPRARKLSVTSSNPSTSTSTSTGNSAPATSPSGYIFPVGRSRAQPSKPAALTISRKKAPKVSNADGGNKEERPRFMGMLLKKKKKTKAIDSPTDPNTLSSGSEMENPSPSPIVLQFDVQPPVTPSRDINSSYEETQAAINQESRERAERIKSRIGSYPLDPYDSVLLDNDRHTGELLVRLNPTSSPSFHHYGNNPPTSVLDLGCGQGHWVLDAAISWKGYGTKVTGYDMVDISQGLLPWAVEQGVKENIRFVRGNFLKQRLPFNDESFDLVRMSCLALCITSDSWIFVLQEVCRVLMLGGRLELIDDMIFFPYGTASSALDTSTSGINSPIESVAPRLDITIPSASFTTFSIYDSETTNPGLGLSVDGTEAEDFYELYGVQEEEVDDDNATVNGFNMNSTPALSPDPKPTPRARDVTSFSTITSRSWNRARDTSGDLEALFEHMLLHKFGINKDPSDFILGLMQQVFGHAREVKTMHLTLAPPESGDDDSIRGLQNGTFDSASRPESRGLSRSPGLVLWPSTFIPMHKSELEIHASKHLRMLLSCKNFLIEHAIEATEGEGIDEDSVLEALWEYEGFLRHRFNAPQASGSIGSDEGSDVVSIRGSIAESVCSDNREAMWEIQSQFIQRFTWQRSAAKERPATPSTPKVQDNTPTSDGFPTMIPSPSTPLSSPTTNLSRRDTVSSIASPLYSRDELAHVRTFRVYEAVKIDEAIFGSAM